MHKKNVVALLMVLCLLFSLTSTSFASDNKETGYDEYTLSFTQSRSNLSLDEKIEQAREFVYSLDLDSKGFNGLESALMQELESLVTEEVDLGTYVVNLPRADEYYGTYDGYMFKAAYTYAYETYHKDLSGQSNILAWINGAMSIAVCWAPDKIAIPYAVFSAIAGILNDSSIISHSNGCVLVTNQDEIVTQHISIEDKDKKLSSRPNSYVLLLENQARVVQTTVATYPGTPYGTPEYDAEIPLKQVYSDTFRDKTGNMKRVLTHYSAGYINDVILDRLPKGDIQWEKK